MIIGIGSMIYLIGRVEGGIVLVVISGCVAFWSCVAGRTCLGFVLGVFEIFLLLVDWFKKKISFIMKDRDISIIDLVIFIKRKLEIIS